MSAESSFKQGGFDRIRNLMEGETDVVEEATWGPETTIEAPPEPEPEDDEAEGDQEESEEDRNYSQRGEEPVESEIRNERESMPEKSRNVFFGDNRVLQQLFEELNYTIGVDADANDYDLIGSIESISVGEKTASITYKVDEHLVNTAKEDVTVPGLESADQEVLEAAYDLDWAEVSLEKSDGYELTIDYEVEGSESPVNPAAKAIRAFDDELRELYELSVESSDLEAEDSEPESEYGNLRMGATEILDTDSSELALLPRYDRGARQAVDNLDSEDAHHYVGRNA